MRFLSRFVMPAAAVTLVTLVAHAKIARTGEAQVSFTATGPAGLSIVGTTQELSVADAGDELVVTVPLKNLDTKIELRNKHMRERYLEVAKYPNAELRVQKSAVKAAAGKASGVLSLHGKSKPTTFAYTTKPDGGATAVTGSFRVNILDFGIEKPGYAGVSVKPDVDVKVAFRVTGE